MKMSLREESGVRVASLAGRLDGFGAKEAEQTLAGENVTTPLVLDCAGL